MSASSTLSRITVGGCRGPNRRASNQPVMVSSGRGQPHGCAGDVTLTPCGTAIDQHAGKFTITVFTGRLTESTTAGGTALLYEWDACGTVPNGGAGGVAFAGTYSHLEQTTRFRLQDPGEALCVRGKRICAGSSTGPARLLHKCCTDRPVGRWFCQIRALLYQLPVRVGTFRSARGPDEI